MKSFAPVPLSELVAGSAGMVLPLRGDDFGAETDPTTTLVNRIVLHEPGASVSYDGALVLVSSPARNRFELGALIEETAGAVALVLPRDVPNGVELSHTGEPHSFSSVGGPLPRLFRRSQWVAWTELFQALILLLGAGRNELLDQQISSLDALARWLSDVCGEAVTIEDLDSRVLAYAVSGEHVDPIRNQTILGGEVPRWRIERLMSSGFLPAVWRSDDVVVRDAEGDDPARMVVALKSGTETVGTIWVALSEGSVREDVRQLLLGVRASAAALLLQQTHRDRSETRFREAALSELLTHGIDPGVPAALLGLDRAATHRVLVLRAEPAVAQNVLFHIQALRAGTMLARDGALSLAVVPMRGAEESGPETARALEEDLRRVLRGHDEVLLALGSAVSGLEDLRGSAAAARRVLGAVQLRWTTIRRSPQGPTVLAEEDLEDSVSLMRILEHLGPVAEEIRRPLSRLEQHDEVNDTGYVATVSAVVEHPGNLAEAARELGIHANTLRYRLDRISAVAGVDPRLAISRTLLSLGLLLRDAEHPPQS